MSLAVSLAITVAIPMPVYADGPPEKRETKVRPYKGVGLLIGGSLVTLGGLGGIVMMALGIPKARSANDFDENDPLEDREGQIDDGRRGNQLAIAGIGLAATLLPTGIVMLAIGGARQRRSRQKISIEPSASPAMAGIRLRGRF